MTLLFTKKSKKGFSLVEMIVFITILTLVSISIVTTLLTMSRSWATIRVDKNVNLSALSSLERLTREIRNATSIDNAQSTLGTAPGVLTLNTLDSGGVATTVKFNVADGKIYVAEGTASAAPLTASSVTVESLKFYRVTSTESEAVRVELQLRSTYQDRTATHDFYTTVSLRGRYIH